MKTKTYADYKQESNQLKLFFNIYAKKQLSIVVQRKTKF
jgi:hypothetical protein